MGRYAVGVVVGLALGMAACQVGPTEPPTASRTSPSGSPATSLTMLDRRGQGQVRLTEKDDGRIVLVDMGQTIVVALAAAEGPWVAPRINAPRPRTGQDRVLYLQQSYGYPKSEQAGARLLAGNPGHAGVVSYTVPAGRVFRVTVYVEATP